ncbi:MAG: hypothetical protein VXZ13_08710 [Pseudomonadota bacterium]|nr:hypothetical protein [Pseudomonadota bacterium]
MGYGIKILGTDGGGNFTVKDTDQNTINYQVVTSGQASSLSGLSLSNSRVFINGNVGSTNTNKFITIDKTSTTMSFKRIGFTGTLGGNIDNITYTTCSVNYLILKQMDAISNSSAQGSYGIQILTSAGVVAFDSRRVLTNDSFFFLSQNGPNTVSGSGGTLSNDGDAYCDSEVFFEFATDSASAIRWRGTGTGTSRIEYLHFRNQQTGGGGGRGGGGGSSTSTSYINNFGTILLGKLR